MCIDGDRQESPPQSSIAASYAPSNQTEFAPRHVSVMSRDEWSELRLRRAVPQFGPSSALKTGVYLCTGSAVTNRLMAKAKIHRCTDTYDTKTMPTVFVTKLPGRALANWCKLRLRSCNPRLPLNARSTHCAQCSSGVYYR